MDLTAGECLCYWPVLWSELPRSRQYMTFARRPTSCNTAPTDITELKRFMGLVNFIGRYVEGLSDKLLPLNELLR